MGTVKVCGKGWKRHPELDAPPSLAQTIAHAEAPSGSSQNRLRPAKPRTSQSLRPPLPHPLPELARSEHLDIRRPAKINCNFEVFTATDFLAAITQHIPDKGVQIVRYYGLYSNKTRGVRHRGLRAELLPHRPGVSPPPPLELPSKRWRNLILRVWHADPLRCPVCQNPMRVIAVIDDPRVVEKILRHLGAWCDPPAGLSPPGAPGPYTYEPCDDVDPAPDFENVLTD